MRRVLPLLLRCYPPAFRRRFGDELALLLDDLLEDRPAGDRSVCGPRRTMRIAADLLASAAAEWRCALVPRRFGRPTAAPVWPRLRGASPQRTAAPSGPAFTPLPGLRRRHAGRTLPARAASL